MRYIHHFSSPLGGITMASDGTALTGLWFDGQRYYGAGLAEAPEEKMLPVFEQTDKWLETYFGGAVPDGMPPLRPEGSPFRRAVWEVLCTIPPGQTMTYGEIAAVLSKERGISRLSARAVGGAVGHNPISLLIPCHRVVGAGGKLTGYAGGVERKAWLLRMERDMIYCP